MPVYSTGTFRANRSAVTGCNRGCLCHIFQCEKEFGPKSGMNRFHSNSTDWTFTFELKYCRKPGAGVSYGESEAEQGGRLEFQVHQRLGVKNVVGDRRPARVSKHLRFPVMTVIQGILLT